MSLNDSIQIFESELKLIRGEIGDVVKKENNAVPKKKKKKIQALLILKQTPF